MSEASRPCHFDPLVSAAAFRQQRVARFSWLLMSLAVLLSLAVFAAGPGFARQHTNDVNQYASQTLLLPTIDCHAFASTVGIRDEGQVPPPIENRESPANKRRTQQLLTQTSKRISIRTPLVYFLADESNRFHQAAYLTSERKQLFLAAASALPPENPGLGLLHRGRGPPLA